MATITPVIVPAKALKDGKHKVRISIAHNGKTRYIVTDITIDSPKEFKNGIIVKRSDAAYLNTKLRGILQRYQEIIDNLGFVNCISCPDLVCHIKNAGTDRHRTLKSVYEEMTENLNLKKGTSNSYRTAWNAIRKLIPEDMLIDNITHATVIALDRKLHKRHLKSGTIRNYVSRLIAIVNYAMRCGYVEYRVNPFNGYSLPHPDTRESWLSVVEIKTIRDLDIKKKNLRKCRDIFMLSYYLGGINIVDLLDINFNEHTSVIKYTRRKTADIPKQNKFVEFMIPQEALEIIKRYKGKDGKIDVSESQRKTRMDRFFRLNMQHLAEAAGTPNLIYYSARKSFSQHAFNLGISTPVIDYILGHKVDKGRTSLFSYISVTPEMATEAVRKVLDNLK